MIQGKTDKGTTITVTCPRCKSDQVWRKGMTPTRQGYIPRFVCYPCGKTFYRTDLDVGKIQPLTPESDLVAANTIPNEA